MTTYPQHSWPLKIALPHIKNTYAMRSPSFRKYSFLHSLAAVIPCPRKNCHREDMEMLWSPTFASSREHDGRSISVSGAYSPKAPDECLAKHIICGYIFHQITVAYCLLLVYLLLFWHPVIFIPSMWGTTYSRLNGRMGLTNDSFIELLLLLNK